ncbi:MAG: hydrogenase 3 maturation endopeptidase HyCI [bacterium]|nr:hydrogenase 3 maturation endopeptidase HyCI [bacterium]
MMARYVLLGVGSRLRNDDAAGSILAERFSERCGAGDENSLWRVIDAESMPENYTSIIKKERPELLVIVDACDLKKEPGEFAIVELSQLSQASGFNTHTVPLSFFIEYLASLAQKVLFIGIQPKNVDIGEVVCPEVEKAVEALILLLEKEEFEKIPRLS